MTTDELRAAITASTEAALRRIIEPAGTVLEALDGVLDPELSADAQNVRVTLAWFRQRASTWLLSREKQNAAAV